MAHAVGRGAARSNFSGRGGFSGLFSTPTSLFVGTRAALISQSWAIAWISQRKGSYRGRTGAVPHEQAKWDGGKKQHEKLGSSTWGRAEWRQGGGGRISPGPGGFEKPIGSRCGFGGGAQGGGLGSLMVRWGSISCRVPASAVFPGHCSLLAAVRRRGQEGSDGAAAAAWRAAQSSDSSPRVETATLDWSLRLASWPSFGSGGWAIAQGRSSIPSGVPMEKGRRRAAFSFRQGASKGGGGVF